MLEEQQESWAQTGGWVERRRGRGARRHAPTRHLRAPPQASTMAPSSRAPGRRRSRRSSRSWWRCGWVVLCRRRRCSPRAGAPRAASPPQRLAHGRAFFPRVQSGKLVKVKASYKLGEDLKVRLRSWGARSWVEARRAAPRGRAIPGCALSAHCGDRACCPPVPLPCCVECRRRRSGCASPRRPRRRARRRRRWAPDSGRSVIFAVENGREYFRIKVT